MKPIKYWLSLFLCISLVLSACGSTAQPTAETILFAQPAPAFSEQLTPSPTSAQPSAVQDAFQNSTSTRTIEAKTPSTTPTSTTPVMGCTSPASLTKPLTEGPYFKANSPERSSLLEANTTGTKLLLTGYVLTSICQPIAHALLDFWQANAQGQYDNAGYTLRGHQFTDANGAFSLVTIVPGLYPGRTEHIHVKVQAPNGPFLTTQLFFPGVPTNQSDGIFDPSLVLPVQQTSNGLTAVFFFIISTK